MKTLTSPWLLRVSIGVALVAVVVLLINPLASIILGKSLNTPWYFAALFTLIAATIVLGLLQLLAKAAEMRQDADEIQNHFNSLAKLDSDFTLRAKSQRQNSSLKVTMDLYGTPITIESPDVGKIEDIVKHLAQGIQASNRVSANPSQTAVRESNVPYNTENNPEKEQ